LCRSASRWYESEQLVAQKVRDHPLSLQEVERFWLAIAQCKQLPTMYPQDILLLVGTY